MRRLVIFGRIIAVLCIAALFSCAPSRAQIVKTVVSGTILDPNGVPYAGGTIDATLVPTGTTPTVAGFGQIDGYVQPVPIATDGSFTLPLFCNSAGGGCSVISPASTQWMFTVRNRGASPPVGYGGISFTVTLTITGATQTITSQLHAAAPQLLVSAAAGAGPVTGSGTTGFLPKWTSSTALGNSACDDGVTTASTLTCAESLAVTANITAPGNVFTGTVESIAATGSDLDVFCDSGGGLCHLNLGSNSANEAVSISGGAVNFTSLSGAQIGSPTGGVKGANSLNVAGGIFVNGVAPVQLANSVNIIPVTANAASTSPQNLQSVSFTAGALNAAGKTLRFKASGTLAVAAGGVGTTKSGIVINLGGSQATNLGVFVPATAGTYSWTIDANCTIVTPSVSAQVVCGGSETFGGVSGSTTQLDNATYPFFATVNAVNTLTTASLLVQGQFSASSTSNTVTSDYLSLEFLN